MHAGFRVIPLAPRMDREQAEILFPVGLEESITWPSGQDMAARHIRFTTHTLCRDPLPGRALNHYVAKTTSKQALFDEESGSNQISRTVL